MVDRATKKSKNWKSAAVDRFIVNPRRKPSPDLTNLAVDLEDVKKSVALSNSSGQEQIIDTPNFYDPVIYTLANAREEPCEEHL